MTEITIRRYATPDCLKDLGPLLNYAFQPSPPIEPMEGDHLASWSRIAEGTETFLLREGDVAAASASYLPMTQNIRGRLAACWGVWGVTCEPAYRRGGHARRVMQALLEAAHQEGVAFSTLYAFRESFYERLGYVGFPQSRRARLNPAHLGGLLRRELPGAVERVPIAQGWDDYRAYLRRLRDHVHGMAVYDVPSHFWREYNDWWLALARIDGEVRGLMVYRLERSSDPHSFRMSVPNFYAHDSAALGLLLNWIARHVDQVNEVTLTLRPTEAAELWWPDLTVRYQEGDAPLGRVVNVTGLAGLPVGSGAFSARIEDPFCGWNAGCYRFESVDGALVVTRLADGVSTDCTLGIQGLGALVYGTHDPAMIPFRGWGDPSPEVQAVLREMFPPLAPYLHEVF